MHFEFQDRESAVLDWQRIKGWTFASEQCLPMFAHPLLALLRRRFLDYDDLTR